MCPVDFYCTPTNQPESRSESRGVEVVEDIGNDIGIGSWKEVVVVQYSSIIV